MNAMSWIVAYGYSDFEQRSIHIYTKDGMNLVSLKENSRKLPGRNQSFIMTEIEMIRLMKWWSLRMKYISILKKGAPMKKKPVKKTKKVKKSKK